MIGLREDQQMKARMVDFLTNATFHCRSELVVASKLACAGVRSAPKKLAPATLSNGSKLPRHSKPAPSFI